MNHLVVPQVVLFGLLIGLRGLHELLALQKIELWQHRFLCWHRVQERKHFGFPCLKARRRPGAPRTTIWDPVRAPDCWDGLDEGRYEYQRNDSHHFDEDVHRGTGRVFERVADGVAYHRGGVSIGTFTSVGASFDVFLCVIPGPA